ncbi:hypothetical protein BJ508DRAFT_309315 [Ascobolus immersus RN42]|uniref:F-box domain-containing protein n=1 Tax=Ascobolus immersus RN42 TaxID=1160509 RepID=A0A3N4I100_ASCIM|nr:hypothetical protein BJ508DRAFT_309315 [Ascobolus immersus RN42]
MPPMLSLCRLLRLPVELRLHLYQFIDAFALLQISSASDELYTDLNNLVALYSKSFKHISKYKGPARYWQYRGRNHGQFTFSDEVLMVQDPLLSFICINKRPAYYARCHPTCQTCFVSKPEREFWILGWLCEEKKQSAYSWSWLHSRKLPTGSAAEVVSAKDLFFSIRLGV